MNSVAEVILDVFDMLPKNNKKHSEIENALINNFGIDEEDLGMEVYHLHHLVFQSSEMIVDTVTGNKIWTSFYRDQSVRIVTDFNALVLITVYAFDYEEFNKQWRI
jgi:hypothetical protein